jgi:2-phosphosulfolactate phosphatase
VDIAIGRGAEVLPQRWADPDAARRDAERLGATSAGPRSGNEPSLRPSSLLGLAAGTRLALPSPNGATLCAAATGSGATVFAGCLRNASAVAAAALAAAGVIDRTVDADEDGATDGPTDAERDGAGRGAIGLVPAGERWPDGTLRVAVEDVIGAGAIAAALATEVATADRSPEAELAIAQFTAARDRGLAEVLAASSSGRELIADGYGVDVTLAAVHDTSSAVPRLSGHWIAAG